MRSEELFLAIGNVEENRLARSEMTVSVPENQKDKRGKRAGRSALRMVLVAALLVSLLAVTAYAVTGFLIFENPEDMVAAIWGDQTGFDHKEVSQVENKAKPGSFYKTPAFDRIPVDETVVAEDIAPHVDVIGKSVEAGGYTLTVDAFMYDEATKCGFVTYLLENPAGIPYKLQSNGEIWYEGMPDPVEVNEYGYPHIIQSKTTPTCLAATYYFRNTGMHGQTLILSIRQEEETINLEELNSIIEELDAEIRKKLTPEEAVKEAKALIGDLIFQQMSDVPEGVDMTQDEWNAERAYTILRDEWYRREYEQKGPSIAIAMEGDFMNHITAENGAITISPISFQLDASNMDRSLLKTSNSGMAEVNSLTICFIDGSEYIVMDDYVDNTMFKLIDSATSGKKDLYNRFTCMFNRIIDVEQITSVILDGNRILVD